MHARDLLGLTCCGPENTTSDRVAVVLTNF